jgi:hypothetical protein
MRSPRIVSFAFLAGIAISAAGAAGASASGVTLKANGQALVAGAPFTASAPNFALALNTHSQQGTLVCKEGGLSGTIDQNGQAIDAATITGSTFTACSEGSVAQEVSATVHAVALKGGKHAGVPGLAELKGVRLTVRRVGAKVACGFAAPRIDGTFPVNHGEGGEPMKVTFTNQRMKYTQVGCWRRGLLSGSFNLTSGGSQITAVAG